MAIQDRSIILFVKIPLINYNLLYEYFVSWSVGQATKGKRASLLMDVVILVLYIKVFLYDY